MQDSLCGPHKETRFGQRTLGDGGPNMGLSFFKGTLFCGFGRETTRTIYRIEGSSIKKTHGLAMATIERLLRQPLVVNYARNLWAGLVGLVQTSLINMMNLVAWDTFASKTRES